MIEQGNQNNQDLLRIYERLSQEEDLGQIFKSLTFIDKDSCIAIQLADFLAFQTRRYSADWVEANGRPDHKPEMISLIEGGVRHIGRVATDFGR